MRSKVETFIQDQTTINHIQGYVSDFKLNLIEGVKSDLFLEDIQSGSGNELESKFKSICSSSALAVNNFAPLKGALSELIFDGIGGFINAQFERKFPTGLKGTPPNLDFVLENNDVVIGFESKFLELLVPKTVKFADSYLASENLPYLDSSWFRLMKAYQGKKLNLDVAQLIKHSIGLLNYENGKKQKSILVYIYWVPENCNSLTIYQRHEKELEEFKKLMKDKIEFKSMTYLDFWNEQKKNNFLQTHFKRVEDRYRMTLDIPIQYFTS